MSKVFNYYRIIRNSIDLKDVQLESLNTKITYGNDDRLNLKLQRSIQPVDETTVLIFLKVNISFEEEGPFEMELILKGRCEAIEEVNPEKLEEFAYEQATPLLLPYARETVASTLARMRLPIYTIPTMDVLGSISSNTDNFDVE